VAAAIKTFLKWKVYSKSKDLKMDILKEEIFRSATSFK
jgi:hypothetical protein